MYIPHRLQQYFVVSQNANLNARLRKSLHHSDSHQRRTHNSGSYLKSERQGFSYSLYLHRTAALRCFTKINATKASARGGKSPHCTDWHQQECSPHYQIWIFLGFYLQRQTEEIPAGINLPPIPTHGAQLSNKYCARSVSASASLPSRLGLGLYWFHASISTRLIFPSRAYCLSYNDTRSETNTLSRCSALLCARAWQQRCHFARGAVQRLFCGHRMCVHGFVFRRPAARVMPLVDSIGS